MNLLNALLLVALVSSFPAEGSTASPRGEAPAPSVAFGRTLSRFGLPEENGKRTNGCRAIAAADFDGDGTPDLIAAVGASDNSGTLILYTGREAAVFGRGHAPAFADGKQVATLADTPTFIGAGDFDADGDADVVVAGPTGLEFVEGDGLGGFAATRRGALRGEVTALAVGDIDRADGLPDVAVAVRGERRAHAVVLESPQGAMAAEPESYALPDAATGLAIRSLDGDEFGDLAVAAGHTLVLVGGRDRRLSVGADVAERVEPAVVRSLDAGARLVAIEAGDFAASEGDEVAALTESGSVLVRSFAAAESVWNDVAVSPGAASLFRTRASWGHDDIAIVSRRGRSVDVARFPDGVSAKAQLFTSVALDADVVEAIPLRLNGDALDDFVIATEGSNALTIAVTAAVDITVTNTNDDGPGSLREALNAANSTVGVVETIGFDIPGSGPHTILLSDTLPLIVDPVVVDGTTQPGYAGVPLIVLDGPGPGSLRGRIAIKAGNSVIRGLNIQNSGYAGVYMNTGGGNVVEGNYIGLDAAGSAPRGNIVGGVYVDGSPNNLIGGRTGAARNVISGNDIGVRVSGRTATGNRIEGNYIGTNAAGSASVQNFIGVLVDGAPSLTVGGSVNGTHNVIAGFRDAGVHIQFPASTSCLIQGNYIGVEASGQVGLPSSIGNSQGVEIYGSPGVTIGGTSTLARNVISGSPTNVDSTLSPAPDLTIQGNFIGTNAAGTAAVPGSFSGVVALGPNVVVGGVAPGAGNVISGNSDIGCSVGKQGASGAVVRGNRIGTDPSGSVAVPNGRDSLSGGGGLFVSSGATVGGAEAGAGNVISGNMGIGLVIQLYSSGSTVGGNLIGVDASGTKAIPNTLGGMAIYGSDNVVGGPGGARNVIAGNGVDGIAILGDTSNRHDATHNIIRGNFIGTNGSGATGLGNARAGVYCAAATSDTTLGDATAGNVVYGNGGAGIVFAAESVEGSTIPNVVANSVVAANGGAGISVTTTTSVTILDNSIHDNGGLGIDLGTGGPEGIDPGDADSGPNSLQNAPILESAIDDESATVVLGTMQTTPNASVRVQLFSSPACDPSGFGEGTTLIGEVGVATDAAGIGAIHFVPAARLAPGTVVTATATNLAGETSEFSNCAIVASPADLSVTATAPSSTMSGAELAFTFTVTNLGPGAAHAATLVTAVPGGTTFLSATSTSGSCTAPPVGGTGEIACQLGDVAVGGSVSVTVHVLVTANPGTAVTASATVAASDEDPDLSNNAATATSTVAADTQPPVVSSVVKLASPFRLKLVGSNFQPGVQVFIGDDAEPWANVRVKATSLTLKKGHALAVKFPKGVAVTIRVVNPDGGTAEIAFTR